MTENQFQFSNKDLNGHITVVGGASWDEFLMNLASLFDRDQVSIQIVLDKMKAGLTGGPGTTEEAVQNFRNAGMNPQQISPPANDQWAGMPPTSSAPPANNWANMNQPTGNNWGGQQAQPAGQQGWGGQRQSSGPPPGMAVPFCNHGQPRQWKEGNGKNGPYRGWVCAMPQNVPGGQCKADWIKD